MPHIIFIHGLSNKPTSNSLLEIWRQKLAHDGGLDLDDLGITSEMVYWADVLYPSPDTNLAAYENAESSELAVVMRAPPVGTPAEAAHDAKYQRLLEALDAVGDDRDPEGMTEQEQHNITLERVPLPAFIRKRIMKRLARDAFLYFYNEPFSARPPESFLVRDELRKRFVDAAAAARARNPNDRVVVLAHSMGTFVAYDCLTAVAECPRVDGFMTIGSPLGIDEVQDFFTGYSPFDAFPREKLSGPWVNVFDQLDAVAGADARLANDFRASGVARVRDIHEPNWGTWRHSISKYLQGRQLREALASMLGVTWP